MNRTPKFKAYIHDYDLICDVTSIDFVSKTIECDLTNGWGDPSEFDFDEIELMEFTGLKDKNDVEIYEGDVVKDCDYPEFDLEFVTFKDGIYRYHEECTVFEGIEDFDLEVVENVHMGKYKYLRGK